MHKLGPASSSTKSIKESREIFLPGEYIMTDLQGPYVRSRTGAYYSQIFIDLVSRRVGLWVWPIKPVRMKLSGKF